MNTVTIVLQDAPYGNEKVWNALRLSQALLTVGSKVRIFLYADSVTAAKKGQNPPERVLQHRGYAQGPHRKGR